MILPGTQLEKLCVEACDEVVLVAPFVKAFVLKELLARISTDITVRCVTRWQPEEILRGVSDLEVWSLIKKRPRSSLWLRSDLHAKFYRADEKCLIGSANLTAKALGWLNSPNLELLVPLPASESILKAFETELFRGCVQVNESLFEQMSETVQILAEQYPSLSPLISDTPDNFQGEISPSVEQTLVEAWLPTLRNPADLYVAYSGKLEQLTTAARETALSDLRSLPTLPNLSKIAFESCIGTLLLQKPIVQKVDALVETSQRFGAVRDLLASLPCANLPDFDPSRAWQTLMRWLLFFLPQRYALSVPNHSEIFYRVNPRT
ncbi:phospholipase D family protein [Desertifilum sp. FACHB-1129]|uniref:PLD phosphodiesterase domain-containing protein n=2 Tax=Desertifilum tharense IPPAS B-1220 TaxID=1781255 RepID=A0A1E5QR09_9CYAN|nr:MULTISPECIES: phospholipase D family protein [Desertifilum]MBD2312299.1 phospholipase D family protein [Desertifilum sp. FACHB-1129]MDA0210813.1 phospholipase D family protein [Cyanobacteria bacterium FC1]MBD2323634.1 phospholipase D family protein [Desertifilum sp. FACHB-866]MBD2332331.1 phospholipase D family protein [Desertifilum sp. FACHB-868]OEJ77027.1 hypothetical protein BH720_00900 [Desertifilum tharense IPPAS B-1220]